MSTEEQYEKQKEEKETYPVIGPESWVNWDNCAPVTALVTFLAK